LEGQHWQEGWLDDLLVISVVECFVQLMFAVLPVFETVVEAVMLMMEVALIDETLALSLGRVVPKEGFL